MIFSASFAQGIDLLGVNTLNGAYLWADEPTAPSYTPITVYQGEQPGRTGEHRLPGPGQANEVELPLQASPLTPTGDVQVTAYGASAAHCQVLTWPATTSTSQPVDVQCFDAAGAPADSRYTLQWMRP